MLAPSKAPDNTVQKVADVILCSWNAGSEIARDPFDFPIAVAGWIGSVAPTQFLGLFPGFAIKFGAPGLRLRERPLGRRRQGPVGTPIGRAASRGRHRPRRIRFGHTYARCELFPERQGGERIDEVGYMNRFSCYLRAWGQERRAGRAGDDCGWAFASRT